MNSSLFHKQGEKFFIENVSVDSIIEQYGSPTYVYSKANLISAFLDFTTSLGIIDHLICFAVKANSNIAILNALAQKGAGFDIVSGGELKRVLLAKGDPQKIVFSGIGKTNEEIELALNSDILCFNIESEAELYRIQAAAKKLEKKAPISIRVNPNVDAKTHPYISTGLKDNKFGVEEKKAIELYKIAKELSHILITGIDCHIGSQITEISPFIDSLNKLLEIVNFLESIDIKIDHLDIGGGIGINYQNETPPSFKEYSQAIKNTFGKKQMKIIFEPGRSIIGKAGALITKVEFLKEGSIKNFAIVDAAMNDLMRPALYDAYHEIINLSCNSYGHEKVFDIVGPVCETADFLGKDRHMLVNPNDYLAILDAGAYGMTMSSNYNSRPRAAEVMIDGSNFFEIKSRETFEQMVYGEKLPPNSKA